MGSRSDRERWDQKYAAGQGPAHFQPKQFLVRNRHLLTGGRALDVACGFGGNALYLASLGYQVDAVDVSGVALTQARAEALRRDLSITFIQADLSRWWVMPARYDLVVVFHYLHRQLMRELAVGLRPGGLLFQVSRNSQFLSIRPGFDPAYLLEPGELRHLASAAGLDVLTYADGVPGEEHVTRLIAQKP